MATDLGTLFLNQSRLIKNRPFKNEFETMCLLFEQTPELFRGVVYALSLEWIKDLEKYENMEFDLKDISEKIKESKELRQKGNQLYTSTGNKRNILAACSLYNDAINAALDTKSEELALGFANRGMALQTFSYYQQAYDDCVWALRLGYPESMRHKIILRQAFCAIKLKNVEKAVIHIEELNQLILNENCVKQYKNLEAALDILKEEQNEGNMDSEKEIVSFNKESQEIITTTEKGRCMIAKCAIKKNQLIFTERITAAVPTGDSRRICQQCLTVNFIPYPCLQCRGRVNYCSIKCQDEHANIHVYECQGYRFQLFKHIGIAHLALRTLLDNGIFSIVDEIKKSNKSTSQVWYEMLDCCGDISDDNSNISTYTNSLRMLSHLDKMSQIEIDFFALVSYLLVVYLKNYTDYFKRLNERIEKVNWEILTGSLILRHIGQSILNGHSMAIINPKPFEIPSNTEYHMLHDKIWASPWHLKLGCLNQFSYYDTLASIIVPYKSLCNHSCVQSYQTSYSGRYVSTYALRNFKKGDEITNCYELDYRKFKRSPRRELLKQSYHFDCKCEDCLKTTDEDVEFNKFHQYRCENRNCAKIFVPNIKGKPTLNWWESDKANERIDLNIYCTLCGCLQSFSWFHEFRQLYNNGSHDSTVRRRLYQIFRKSENTLIGLNDARGYVAFMLIKQWFKLPFANICLKDRDYSELLEMIKYLQELNAAECSENSQEYIIVLTFLWDLIALRKYKCSKDEMSKMLFAISILSDDTKRIFLNYYSDYIKNAI